MSIQSEPTPSGGAPNARPPAVFSKESPAQASVSLPPPRYKRILVPIDFSECSLNALEYAISFAGQYQATLLPFHVIEPAFSGLSAQLEETHERLLREARDHLHVLCRRYLNNRIPHEILVRIGRPPSEIADTAKALGADLIIMGTHGTRGHKPSVMGSTAERVVRQASCPVLTVRFPGAPGAKSPTR